MAKTVSGLKDHLGYWLRMVSNEVSFSFAAKIEASGVTVAEWVILREMFEANEGISPSLIAERTGHTRGAISKLIDRLLQKKLIVRRQLKTDARYQEVKLSEKGRALVPKLARLADENDEASFGFLSDAERGSLRKILEKIVAAKNLSKVPTE